MSDEDSGLNVLHVNGIHFGKRKKSRVSGQVIFWARVELGNSEIEVGRNILLCERTVLM